jgi:hypothetical protein
VEFSAKRPVLPRRTGAVLEMKPNLDSLKIEIQEHLESEGFAVFHGHSRTVDARPAVYWDCDEYPDYQMFVKTAKAAGANLIVFHHREFSPDQVEDAIERLEAVEMPRDEYRNLERRLREMRVYEGFTCIIELSFAVDGRAYVFDLRTEWYEELSDLLDDLDVLGGDIEDEDEGPMSGYFSKN